MPRKCLHCIWGFHIFSEGSEGVKCANPSLEGIQKGNVMPLAATACGDFVSVGNIQERIIRPSSFAFLKEREGKPGVKRVLKGKKRASGKKALKRTKRKR